MGNFSSINPWIPESRDFWFSQIHTDGEDKYPNVRSQGTQLFRTKDIRYQFSTICADTKIWMRFDSSPFLLAIATTSVERPAKTGLSPLLIASSTINLPV